MTTFIKERFQTVFIAFYIIAIIALIGYSLIPFLSSQASVANDWAFAEPGNSTIGPSYTNVFVLGINLPVNSGGVDSITDTIVTNNADAAPAAGFDFSTSTWTNVYYADDSGNDGAYNNGEAIVSTVDANLDAGVLSGAGTDDVLTAGTADIRAFASTDFVYDDNTLGDNNDYDNGEAIIDDNDADVMPTSGDAVITAGKARVIAFDAADKVYLDDANSNNEYDAGEEIFWDVAEDGFTALTDWVLVGDGAPGGAGLTTKLSALGDEAGLAYLDDNNDGAYATTKDTSGETIVWYGTAGNPTDGDNLSLTVAFLDPAQLAQDDINGTWLEDMTDMSTITDIGYCDNGHTTAYANGDAILQEAAAAAIDANMETTDTVLTTGTCDLATDWAAQDLYHGDNGNYDGSSDIIHDDDTSGYYNGDQLTSIKIGSPGTCNENSINKITIWEDGVSPGWDGDETAIGSLTQSGIGTLIGQTITTAGASVYTSGSDAQRIMVTIDTTATPTDGCTFSVGMPTNAAVLVSNNDGPTDTNKAATSTFTVDSSTTVSDGAISIISNGSGNLGVEEYIIGDALTVQWDDTIDSNGDIASATVNFSSFGGGAAVAMEDDGAGGTCNDGGAADNVWCATYTIAAGAVDTDGANNLNVSVTANDTYGNTATTGDTTGLDCDNIAPTIGTPGTITLTDTSGEGIASIGENLTYAGGVPGVADGDSWTTDLSAYAGSGTQAPGAWAIIADNDDGAFASTETISDDAGNTAAGGATLVGFANIDNVAPTIGTPGTITLTDTSGEGIASIGENLTYAGGVPGVADGDSWTTDLSAYAGSGTQAPGAWAIIADNDDGAFASTETITDNGGNTATGGATLVGFANIDNIAPIFATSGLTISTDNGIGGVAAVNGNGVAVDAVNVNATAGAADGDTITWDASPLGGGASATQANNTPVSVAAGAIDNAIYPFNVTITDNGGNSLTQDTNTIDATTISLDNIIPALATSGLTISTDNGIGGVAAVNGGGVAADQVNVNATVAIGDGDTITWDASPLGGGASATQANNTPVNVAAGAIDNAAYAFIVTATDNAGNAINLGTLGIDGTTISLDNILPTVTAAGTVILTIDIGGEGIASIGDTITYAGGTEGTGDGLIGWTVDLSIYGLSATQAPGAVVLIPDNDDGVSTPNELVADNAGNVQGGAPTPVAFGINVDNIAPAFATSGLSISTDNGVAGTAAVNNGGIAADQVTLNATVAAADSDTITWDASGIGGGALQANNSAVVVSAGAIDNAAYVFNVTATDDANNTTATNTNVIDGSTISIDNIVPTVLNTYSIDSDTDGDIDTFDAQFSENMLDSSFNPAGFEGDNDNTNDGVAEEIASGGGTAVTQPGVDVDANDDYYSVTLTTGLAGTDIAYLHLLAGITTLSDDGGNYPVAGDALGTENDAAPAVIVSTSPADSVTGVSRYATPSVTFSEPMNTGTYTYAAATQPTGGYTLSWDGTNSTVTFNHATAYGITTVYDITTTAGNGQDGLPFAVSLVPNPFSFTTTGGGGGGGGGVSASITGSISINNGGTQTESNTVTLNLATSGGTQMVISNDPYLANASWETFKSSKTWELESGLGARTVYVRYKNEFGAQSTTYSDSINVVEQVTEEQPPVEVPEEVITEEQPPAAPLPEGVEIGQLVRRADMPAVYFIDNDNRRHAFPNETVFYSWFTGFDEVQTISAETLAAIPLGSNVTMRPGTWMIKIQSDPKVYTVEPYGIIRWVSSEEIAQSLYGPNWNRKIVDVDVTFFVNYQEGSAITTPVHATGTLMSYEGSTAVYYIDEGYKRYVSSEVFVNNYFQNRFVQTGISTGIGYPDGEAFPNMTMDELMKLL